MLGCSPAFLLCSNNFLVVERMAGSHVGITIEDLQREQDSIDKFIDTLLTSDPATLLCEPHRDIVKETSTPPRNSPTQAKRGRGRPPKIVKPSLGSSFSPVQRPATKKPSLDNIFECISKLNSQNRNLMLYVQSLSDSVNKCSREHTTEETISDTSGKTDDVKIEISDRLEKIEQSINSNILVCSGPSVPELVNEVKTDSSINFDRLKGNLCTAICGEEVTEIDIKNLRVSLFGRERKSLKIECANPSSKLHIIKQARGKKPKGIYISEFLSKPRLQVLRNLKNLKKLHPRRIKSVFTKEGNIFYRLQGADRPVLVKSNKDIENIVRELPITDNSETTDPNLSISTTAHTHPPETISAAAQVSATAEASGDAVDDLVA